MHPNLQNCSIYNSQDMKQPYTATRMDLEIITLSEEGQTERQMSYDIAYMCNLKFKKNDTNELIYKASIDP